MGQLGRSLARLFSQQHPAPHDAPHKEHAQDHQAHGQPARQTRQLMHPPRRTHSSI